MTEFMVSRGRCIPPIQEERTSSQRCGHVLPCTRTCWCSWGSWRVRSEGRRICYIVGRMGFHIPKPGSAHILHPKKQLFSVALQYEMGNTITFFCGESERGAHGDQNEGGD